jgi:hypothetical protein
VKTVGRRAGRIGLRNERWTVQYVQIYQKEKDVHKNEHDERYKCAEMRYQDNDNKDEKSYTLKTHMERNENLIYDYDRDAEMEKNDNLETVEKDNQKEIYCQGQSRHSINKIS